MRIGPFAPRDAIWSEADDTISCADWYRHNAEWISIRIQKLDDDKTHQIFCAKHEARNMKRNRENTKTYLVRAASDRAEILISVVEVLRMASRLPFCDLFGFCVRFSRKIEFHGSNRRMPRRHFSSLAAICSWPYLMLCR